MTGNHRATRAETACAGLDRAPEHHPLTPYQQDIWAAEAQAPGSPQFITVMYQTLTGSLDTALLRDCFARILERHETFRLRFAERDGVPFQWTVDRPGAERGDDAVDVVDFTAERDPRAVCGSWRDRAMIVPFEVFDRPLFQAAVLVEGPGTHHLFLKCHHLLVDGWAVDRLRNQILADYASRVRGQSRTADEPEPSPLAVAAERASYFGSAEHRQDLAFHRAALSGTEPHFLPRRTLGDGETGASGRSAVGRHAFRLPAQLADRMKEQGGSIPAYLLAVLGVYLCRLHRADHVVVGVPLLNRRTRAELDVAASYANTLPLRIDVPEGRTLGEITHDVRKSLAELQQHQRVPSGDIVRDLTAGGSRDRRLFDVTFSYLKLRQRVTPEGMKTEPPVHFAPPHVQEALAVHVTVSPGTTDLTVDLNHALDVFDADLPIVSVAGHMRQLITRGLAEPGLPARDLPLLTDAEQERLSCNSQGPRVRHPVDQTLHGLFEEQARRTPDRPAIVAADGGGLTYAELDVRANQVARALRRHGVGPDDRVALLMRRSPLMLIGLLGVLKAGGAYVPVDPAYPERRVADILTDCGARAVLADTAEDLPTGFATAESAAANVDATAHAAAPAPVLRVVDLLQGPSSPVESRSNARDLAYVIYTSGSTGRPKGVMVEHRSVVNRLAWMQRAHPLTADDVILHKTPATFDVSVWELLWWSIAGARTALLEPGGEKDPRAILRCIEERKVTTLHFVPSMLGPFLDLLDEHPRFVAATRTLRQVFSSGEALSPARVEQFHRIFRVNGTAEVRPALVNLYGPTEATVDVSVYECSAGVGPTATVPIGRPIDNIELYVMDPAGRQQPVGVAGELWIGGVGVARGYLNRSELTQEMFRADPLAPGGHLYRTGDLARWLADGTLEYLGRLDDQVKIRGNRVEPGEVEAALTRQPGVRDAVVVARARPDGEKYLAGYYVPDTGCIPDPSLLREQLAEFLPQFMIPARLVALDRIPVGPNGKADRRALPDPAEAPGTAGDLTPPRTPTEEALAAIWAEVLGTGPISREDDYYALGGDSLQMLRIRALAERRGLHFTLSDMVWHPTVAALAAVATTTSSAQQATEPGPFALVSRVDRARLSGAVDAFPLTRLQLGLLYHSRRHDKSAVYHDVFRYRLILPWDQDRFRQAFDRLTARHPALRSSFALGGFAEPLQIVYAEVAGGLDTVDLRGCSAPEAEEVIGAYVEQRRFHHYRFDEAPLYRFRVYVRDDDAIDLMLSFHHALLDGGSVAVLLAELIEDYLHSMGAAVEAAPDGVLPSAAHHVRDERAALADPAAREHWARVLAGTRALRLDGFASHEPPREAGAIVYHARLPDQLADSVREFASRQALPVKSVLLAAYCQTLLAFTSPDGDLTVGVITHGRPEREDADRMTGLFLNTVPVRLAGDGGSASRIETVRDVFHQERCGRAHQHYPLSAMQEDRDGSPVVLTAFNYVHFRVLSDVLGRPEVRLESFRTWEETNFQLLVNAFVDPVDDRMSIRIDGDGRVVTPAQAALLAETFRKVLHRIVTHPDEPVGCDFLPPAEPRRGASTEWSDDVVTLFGRQAAETPDAVAVLADGREQRRWTYRQLSWAAEGVAARLLDVGIRPGDRVGIAMDRSPEAIAVVLGTAMAGAVCVPLDVGYPPARLAAMVEQARPVRVVVREEQSHLVPDSRAILTVEELFFTRTTGAPVPRVCPDPARTAYVLFTSGSTGRPKGISMPHRSLANLVGWQMRRRSGAVGATTAQYAPLSFDVSFQEIYSTLCSGGTLRLVSEAERGDMAALLRLLDEDGVERIFLPYVVLQRLAEAYASHGVAPRRLRVVISSGEQLRVTEEIRHFLAALPGALLENQYGPTETHVVTSHTLTGHPDGFPAIVPIGTPIDGVEVHVLDPWGRPVPTGVRGELCVWGVALADGYLGDPGPAAERFVSLASPSGSRGIVYRTGDLALVRPDGTLVYAGRDDEQVKIRGYRVEPAEVELAIGRIAARHPALDVTEAAVVARQRAHGESVLVAFLAGRRECADAHTLREALRATLPEYMVPAHFEWLPRLPLTPSGKRDDRALRGMPLTRPTVAPKDAPRDRLERALAAMAGDLLGSDAIARSESLFNLGATSITVVRLVAQIEQRYGRSVPLSAFVTAPTVAALAELLRSTGAAPSFDPVVPIRTGGTRPPLFLVHPMGGNVLCYLPFARHLPPDQPLYALEAVGAEPGSTPSDSIPDLADRYLTALRRVQPEGPYTLGGWSFGGFVAFEMARRLRASGESIRPVLLLDTVALATGDRRDAYPDEALIGWFFWELLLLGGDDTSVLAGFPPELTTLDEKFAFIARIAADTGVLSADGNEALVRRLFRMYAAHWRSVLRYRPRDTSIDVTLLRAEEPLPEVLLSMHSAASSQHREPANGWRTMTSGTVDVVSVPGDHLTLMQEPHVREVARIAGSLIRVTGPSRDDHPAHSRLQPLHP
ncbi:amino acid adenylation domain-containing protein [Streptomyces sp. NPDC058295]|uniref:amino acid adenylation domain-containing protein n=1 Tax=Streptomyces sp. NPDC058295 TaxID=3346431 RepID=UPI0036EAD738